MIALHEHAKSSWNPVKQSSKFTNSMYKHAVYISYTKHFTEREMNTEWNYLFCYSELTRNIKTLQKFFKRHFSLIIIIPYFGFGAYRPSYTSQIKSNLFTPLALKVSKLCFEFTPKLSKLITQPTKFFHCSHFTEFFNWNNTNKLLLL